MLLVDRVTLGPSVAIAARGLLPGAMGYVGILVQWVAGRWVDPVPSWWQWLLRAYHQASGYHGTGGSQMNKRISAFDEGPSLSGRIQRGYQLPGAISEHVGAGRIRRAAQEKKIEGLGIIRIGVYPPFFGMSYMYSSPQACL